MSKKPHINETNEKSNSPLTEAASADDNGMRARSAHAQEGSVTALRDRPSMHTTTQSPISTALYLVATPIGNLEDITLRAIRILKECAVIACEDTRTSAVLLRHYGITTPTISYHEHNGEQMRPKILARLNAGESVALISDAGTPLINDPGYKLVREVTTAGHAIIPIPGPSSLLAALIASGQPTDTFTFIGFLPNKQQARRTLLESHCHTTHTLIAFESPNRLSESLNDMLELWGDTREVSVARELTKRFEEHRRGSIGALAAHYASSEAPRGEIVLIIGPAAPITASVTDIDTMLIQALTTHSVKDAAHIVALATGTPKRDLYQRALALHAKP